MWAQVLNTALGIWLMAASAVLGYSGPARTSDQIAGAIIATFACCAIWPVTRPWRWVNVPLGAWVAVAPLVLDLPAGAAVHGVAAGVLVVALACVRGRVRTRFGGGWSALWTKDADLASG